MMVIVDTPIWSRAYRHASRTPRDANTQELARLIRDQQAEMLGPVRQELLSGVPDQVNFQTLRSVLRAFPDLPIKTEDHELAGDYYNLCRSKGVQGSNTDFLICAVAKRYGAAVFTTDKDFTSYSKLIGLVLHKVGKSRPR